MKRWTPVIAFHCLALLTACNSGRPPKIGEAAPDFTITDSQRTVTLSQIEDRLPGDTELLGDVVSAAVSECRRWWNCKKNSGTR